MSEKQKKKRAAPVADSAGTEPKATAAKSEKAKEFGGRKGPDPTRYGDWEKNGRCVDF